MESSETNNKQRLLLNDNRSNLNNETESDMNNLVNNNGNNRSRSQNILSLNKKTLDDNDVFGFEESSMDNEMIKNYQKDFDDDYDGNDNDDLNGSNISNINSSVLRKRNSNLNIDDQTDQDFITKTANNNKITSSNMIISNHQNINKNSYNLNNNNNKYSCSLPREIPNMSTTRLNTNKNTENYNSYVNKNSFNDVLQENENGENEDFSNDFDDENDFEVGVDMSQRISNLASSIVAKDGRELFGGVPSRRIPINSISQSYF